MMSNDGNPPNTDIIALQENFSKQQKKICDLKELVRTSDLAHGKSTSSAKEKVKNIEQRLTNLKYKARYRKGVEAETVHSQIADISNLSGDANLNDMLIGSYPQVQLPSSCLSLEITPALNLSVQDQNEPSSTNSVLNLSSTTQPILQGSGTIELMRQQMEENKERMAQRVSSKQHLEQLVTQLKEKFDSTQQCLEDTCDLGRSMSDLSALAYTSAKHERHKSATDLPTQTFNLDRERMKFFENRCRLLEKQFEKEKQAHSIALTDLQSSKKLIAELTHKILEVEDSRSERETNINTLKLQKHQLGQELEEIKLNKCKEEELAIHIVAAPSCASQPESSCELTLQHSKSRLNQVKELEESLCLGKTKLENTQRSLQQSEYQCSSLQAVSNTGTVAQTRLTSQNTDIQIKEEMMKQITELKNELEKLKDDNANLQQCLDEKNKLETSDTILLQKLRVLTTTIESQREDLQKHIEESNRYEDEIMEKTIELNVLKANFKVLEEKLQGINKKKSLFTVSAEDAVSQNSVILTENQHLKQTVDEANKAMIKLRLKCKQTEKQVEKLTKTEKVASLEKVQMQQKIMELEAESRQRQVKQVQHADIATQVSMNTNNEIYYSDSSDKTMQSQFCSVIKSTAANTSIKSSTMTEICQEESSDLINKIELLTGERQDILNEMQILTLENQELRHEIQELKEEKEKCQINDPLSQYNLESHLQELSNEQQFPYNHAPRSSAQRGQPLQDRTSLHSSEVLGVLEVAESNTLFNTCENTLLKLNLELEAYEGSNDKNSKLKASKKLAKEAKKVYIQLSELLHKVKEDSSAVETITVVDTGVAVTVPNGKAFAEYEELAIQNSELKETIEELRRELQAQNIYNDTVEKSDFQLTNSISVTRPCEEEGKIVPEFEPSLNEYQSQCQHLQLTIDELRAQQREMQLGSEEKTREINRLNGILQKLDNAEVEKIAEASDQSVDHTKKSYEKEVQRLTNLKRQLEVKCEAYEDEVELLGKHITAQNQKIIQLCKENEYKNNLEKLDLQKPEEEMMSLQAEVVRIASPKVFKKDHLQDELQSEYKNLNESLKEQRNLISQQENELVTKQTTIDALNQQVTQLCTTIEENSRRLVENEDGTVRLQGLLAESIKTNSKLRKDNDEQKIVVDKLLAELHSNKKTAQNLIELEADLKRLQQEKADLAARNKCIEQRNNELLEKLKKYAATLKKRTSECQEYKGKIKDLEKGTFEILEGKQKADEIQQLQNVTTDPLAKIRELERALEKTQNEYRDLRETLTKNNLNLLESQKKTLEKDIDSLPQRLKEGSQNNDLMDDADTTANMPGLTQESSIPVGLVNKELTIDNENTTKAQEHRLFLVNEELKSKSIKFEKSKAIIKDRNSQIQRLQAEIKDLQTKFIVKNEEQEMLQHNYIILNQQYQTDKANFEDTIARLESFHNGIQAKLRDESIYINSLEQEITNYKEHIRKLEQCVCIFEKKNGILPDLEMPNRIAEHDDNENLLCRLNTLLEHADIVAKRLMKAKDEKKKLKQDFTNLFSQLQDLLCKYSQLKNKQEDFRTEIFELLERENVTLRDQFDEIKKRIQRTGSAYDSKLIATTKEIHDLENYFKNQLHILQTEKNLLSEELISSQTDCAAQKDAILDLKDTINSLQQVRTELERESSWLRMSQDSCQQYKFELEEMRIKNMQDNSEIEHLHHQIDALTANHEIDLQALRMQISELDTVRMQVGQNQTDDQVFLETENKRLTDLIAEKNAQIEIYQHKNLQLQMNAAAPTRNQLSYQQSPGICELTFSLPSNTVSSSRNDKDDRESSELESFETSEMAVCLQRDCNSLQAELRIVQESNNDLKRQLADKQHELKSMSLQQQHVSTSQHDVNVVDRNSLVQRYTIEDLQRNVSDLEKHAQDLEQKMMVRNHRDGEAEERLCELQQKLVAAEQLIHTRDEQLRFMKLAEERQQTEYHKVIGATKEKVAELQAKLDIAELQIHDGKTIIAEKERNLEFNLQTQIDGQLEEGNVQLDHLQCTLNKNTNPKVCEESSQCLEKNSVDGAVGSTLDMFFDSFSAPERQLEISPVVEETIVPENAYLCGPQEPIAEVDWEMNNEPGREQSFLKQIQEASQHPQSLISREQELEIQIQGDYKEMNELQFAYENCKKQNKELHRKLDCMMKKLKKYKLKIDELHAQNINTTELKKNISLNSNTAADLDVAIYEELKIQIKQLEAQTEEQSKQIKNQNLEKEKLLKRLEVLVAGNEHISDLKERQDLDVQMYQSRINELQEKLRILEEWSEPEPGDIKATNTISREMCEQNFLEHQQSKLLEKIAALEGEVKDINDERQELQVLLEEEKLSTSYADETICQLKNKVLALQHGEKAQYNELKLDYQNLQELSRELQEENTKLEKDVRNLEETLRKKHLASAEFELNLQILRERNEQLQSQLLINEQQLNDMQLQLVELRAENTNLLNQNQEMCKQQLLEVSNINGLEEQESQKLERQNSLITLHTEMPSHHTYANKSIQSETSVCSSVDGLWSHLQEKGSEIRHQNEGIKDIKLKEIKIPTNGNNIENDNEEPENYSMLDPLNLMLEGRLDANVSSVQEQLQLLNKHVQELEEDKRNMEIELEALNTRVLSSFDLEDKLKAAALELDAKNIELIELREILYKQQSKKNINLHPGEPAVDIDVVNSQWKAHVEQKCIEIAEMWRQHLEISEMEFKTRENKLQEEILMLRATSAAIPISQQSQHVESTETTATSTDESISPSGPSSIVPSKSGTPLHRCVHNNNNKEIDESVDCALERMQIALESQEMEIVTLKEQLAIRSAEYARLAAQYDPFKLQTTLSHSGVRSFSTPTFIESPVGHRLASTADSSTVPKTELDLAMYMLHQRDMRCEEMALELVSLLEERDTLQLKLSNSLRQVEAMKTEYNNTESIPLQIHTESVAPNDVVNSGPIAAITERDPSDELNQKLSQLQSVNHSKDKIIKEERDQRFRQMLHIQQDVAKMPSEALSGLISSNLTQSDPSSSSVLLNWLWGNKPRPTANS